MSLLNRLSVKHQVLWLVFILLLLGEVILFSATGVMGMQKFGSEFYYLIRHSLTLVAGLAIMYILSVTPYQIWYRFALVLLAAQIVLVAATHFTPFSREALGASRWLSLGSFRFQPSELVKVTVAIYLARWLAQHRQTPLTTRAWLGAAVPLIILMLMVYLQPDLGTTVLMALVVFGLFFVAGMRPWYVLSVLGTGATLFIISLMQSEYRRRRLLAFLNPWADPQGGGFQSIQSFLSFHSGKLTGVGIGNGNSKLFYLPEVHTDFIFSLIGEELGFIGASLVIVLFAYLCYLLFRIASRCKDPFGSFLAFSLTLFIALQIAVNLGGVTGLIPAKGLPLPFMSWGRTALIANLAGIGILLNILSQSEIIQPPCKQETKV